MGITAGSREVPGRNACDRRHTYCIIIIIYSIIKRSAKITGELSQTNEKSDAKQNGIQHKKARLGESLKKKWKNKVMHGQYIRNIDRQLIGEEDTFLRL